MAFDFQLYCVSIDKTLYDAIEVINADLSRCAIVVGPRNNVVGVISEGDVMRFLLEGISLQAPLSRLVDPSFISLSNRDLDQAFILIKRLGISLIPIVDTNGCLTDIISLADVLESMQLRSE
ncbi:MAG: hypothetical protein CMO98_01385 [Woeseia sp.]|nr:hypothetical protein [Woeseia sp.]|tara:strand:+ start:699 stop:1064 length:366 start_codon:yes stop_codon:yes gene_type:complete